MLTIYCDHPCHSSNCKRGREGPVRYLVIHYVGAAGGARANARYYGSTPGIGASAHYFVGHASEGAVVYASVPEGDTAWHCGRRDGKYRHPECRNANSIGIELCCHRAADGTWYFDPETLAAGAELARYIMGRYGIPLDHVLRHYDVTGKVCPEPFVRDTGAWAEFKNRLKGDGDMTKEEVQKLVEAAVAAAQPRVYTDLAQVPEWAQGLVGRAMDAGILHGSGGGRLRLTDDNLVSLQMLANAHIF